MSALVDDLLLLARLDQGRPLESASIDLAAVVRDAGADARAVAPDREVTVAADAPVLVNGDDMRLRQVVGNLVRNALVHTPPGTPLELNVRTEGASAVLTVADHGPGIQPDDSTRLFEPFYRSDPGRSRDRGGSGLGLSIVAAVVAAHGGRVRVEATPGGGATFVVELPSLSAIPYTAGPQLTPQST
jgi:two-component system OmpR family sensor kinase